MLVDHEVKIGSPCRTQPYYVSSAEHIKQYQPLNTMDDYLRDTLSARRMCKINQLLYALLEEVADSKTAKTESMRTMVFKLKATVVHSVYHSLMDSMDCKDFVQQKQWPPVMSFAPARLMLRHNFAVPVPYMLTTMKQAEYSSAIMAYYKALCEVQNIPCIMDRLHLHRFGWLKHTDKELLLKAPQKMSRGQFETLRGKALKALNHVMGLGIETLIEELHEVDGSATISAHRAPVQRPLTDEIQEQIQTQLEELNTAYINHIRTMQGQLGWQEVVHASGRHYFQFFDKKHEYSLGTAKEIQEILTPLVFGYMLYGKPEIFKGSEYSPEGEVKYATALGFRRDHLNIGFDISDPVQLILPQVGETVLTLHVRKKNKATHRVSNKIYIDGTSAIGQAMWLLGILAKHANSSRLIFYFRGTAPNYTIRLPAMGYYDKMRRYFNIPAGMGGTTAARLTHAERDNMEYAAAVQQAGGVTEELMERRAQGAEACLHTVNEHEKYAMRAAKRKKDLSDYFEDTGAESPAQ